VEHDVACVFAPFCTNINQDTEIAFSLQSVWGITTLQSEGNEKE